MRICPSRFLLLPSPPLLPDLIESVSTLSERARIDEFARTSRDRERLILDYTRLRLSSLYGYSMYLAVALATSSP
jgi:hypothetical protein